MTEPNSPGVPVVFVHGIRVGGAMWGPVAELVGRERAVAMPDLPGHGARRGETFTMAGAVAAVVDAVEELGRGALLVGHSLGGYVAMASAGRYPQQVAGLVAMGSTAQPEGAVGAAYLGASRWASRFPEHVNRLSRRGFSRVLPARSAAAMSAGGLSSEVIEPALRELRRSDVLGSLARFRGPVWLVNGAWDALRADERRFLRACVDGRLLVRPGCGHISCLADPSAVARTVLDVAARVDSLRGGGERQDDPLTGAR